jgi:uncharacterized protein DUF2330
VHRSKIVLGSLVATSALALAIERDAAACGGCFQPPPPPSQSTSDITDERMLLAVSTQQSTLYDQITYSGSPSSFAWVLPIHGTVDIGLSADVLFDSMDTLTQTQVIAPPVNCPSPSGCGGGVGCGSSSSAGVASFSAAGGANSAPPVTVTKQENVGPYDTVQLHATDASALNNWLSQNGFDIPTSVTPVIDAYVTEGFDFLAMKLLPNQGVQSMRPVRVTTPGAGLSLPLRMASIGTGVTVGITIWIVSDGRYEPQNFPFFHIDDSSLVWDFSTSSSNYTTLRAQNEATLHNAGWEIESSISLNEQAITSLILSGGTNGNPNGGVSQSPPSDPSLDYLAVGDPDGGTEGGAEGGAGAFETAEQVRTDDINALFAGLTGPTVRVTRVRSDIAHAAMTADLVFQASIDQSELSNVRTATQSVNETCPIYNGCSQVGTGTRAQAQASISGGGCAASQPATRGSAATFAALAGMLALVAARTARTRRRLAKKRSSV